MAHGTKEMYNLHYIFNAKGSSSTQLCSKCLCEKCVCMAVYSFQIKSSLWSLVWSIIVDRSIGSWMAGWPRDFQPKKEIQFRDSAQRQCGGRGQARQGKTGLWFCSRCQDILPLCHGVNEAYSLFHYFLSWEYGIFFTRFTLQCTSYALWVTVGNGPLFFGRSLESILAWMTALVNAKQRARARKPTHIQVSFMLLCMYTYKAKGEKFLFTQKKRR